MVGSVVPIWGLRVKCAFFLIVTEVSLMHVNYVWFELFHFIFKDRTSPIDLFLLLNLSLNSLMSTLCGQESHTECTHNFVYRRHSFAGKIIS